MNAIIPSSSVKTGFYYNEVLVLVLLSVTLVVVELSIVILKKILIAYMNSIMKQDFLTKG